MLFERHIRRAPILFSRAKRIVARLDTVDLRTIHDFQREALHLVVRRAASLSSMIYPAGVPFDHFPFLTKAEVRANPKAYLGRSILPDTTATTSGTSGTSLTLHRSLWCVVFEEAIFEFLAKKVGGDFGRDRIAVLRGIDIKLPDDQNPPFWRLERSGRRLVFSSNHLNLKTSRHFAKALRDFSPGILWAYPSVAAHLADLLELSAEKIRIPVIMTGSEMLHPHVRRRLSEVFDARVLDYYGQGERVCFAYSVEEGSYRFISSYGFVEFIPAENDQSNAFEIVGTSYHNARQVFVRYRTGDIIRFPSKPANLREIADGRMPFMGIAGRDSDVLRGLNGEILVGIDHIPRGLEELGRFQFAQPTPDLIEILVSDPTGGSQVRADLVVKQARRKIPSSIAIKVQFVDDLRRSKAGKVPFVWRGEA